MEKNFVYRRSLGGYTSQCQKHFPTLENFETIPPGFWGHKYKYLPLTPCKKPTIGKNTNQLTYKHASPSGKILN